MLHNPPIAHLPAARVLVIQLVIVAVTIVVKEVVNHGVPQNVRHRRKTRHRRVLVVAIFVMVVPVFAKGIALDPVLVHPIKVTNND